MATDQPIKHNWRFKDLTGQRFGRLVVGALHNGTRINAPVVQSPVSPITGLKSYPLDISTARNLRGELRIPEGLTRDDLEKLRRQVGRQLDAIADGFDEPDGDT